jgi:hypothetical protein
MIKFINNQTMAPLHFSQLSLQETLLGCKSEMPGNSIFLETIFLIIDVVFGSR